MNHPLPILGEPLPGSPHAISVSLPTWRDVVGYEEGEARVVTAMKTGYPRFFYHPLTKKLFAAAEKQLAREDEFCLAFPSRRIAELGRDFCGSGRVEKFSEGIYALVLPRGIEKRAQSFWQHPGYIVSSRQAETVLTGRAPDARGGDAKAAIRQHVAKLSGERPENIYLFPSGMAALFTAFEIASAGPTVQLGFPYVDTLKIQEKFGRETIFLPDVADLEKLKSVIKTKKVSAVFTEFPCNPLIACVDLQRLSSICRAHHVALIIDDTLSSWANVDLTPYADMVASSLSKFFSGGGDVLAGSLILNAKSPIFAPLKKSLDAIYEDLLFGEDAIVLEKNSADFSARIAKINANAEGLVDWLTTLGHPGLTIYYTKGNPVYERYKTGGYGGIISLVMPSEAAAIAFYDALEVNKGPSLGTNFTLVCPYTLLAHYHERAFAEAAGVPFHLIRVSVGLEEFGELKDKFQRALALALGTVSKNPHTCR